MTYLKKFFILDTCELRQSVISGSYHNVFAARLVVVDWRHRNSGYELRRTNLTCPISHRLKSYYR